MLRVSIQPDALHVCLLDRVLCPQQRIFKDGMTREPSILAVQVSKEPLIYTSAKEPEETTILAYFTHCNIFGPSLGHSDLAQTSEHSEITPPTMRSLVVMPEAKPSVHQIGGEISPIQ